MKKIRTVVVSILALTSLISAKSHPFYLHSLLPRRESVSRWLHESGRWLPRVDQQMRLISLLQWRHLRPRWRRLQRIRLPVQTGLQRAQLRDRHRRVLGYGRERERKRKREREKERERERKREILCYCFPAYKPLSFSAACLQNSEEVLKIIIYFHSFVPMVLKCEKHFMINDKEVFEEIF